MSDIDDKLRKIVEEMNYPGWSDDQAERYVGEIKQAFAEAGYVPLGLVRQLKNPDVVAALHESGFGVSDYFDSEVLTGQEWYQRFYKELSKLPYSMESKQLAKIQAVMAAKRAAGLDT